MASHTVVKRPSTVRTAVPGIGIVMLGGAGEKKKIIGIKMSSTISMRNDVINISRAWDKKKSLSPRLLYLPQQ